ncbi:MAG TPA: hypothetical protein VIV58_31205 [Kofleriaceae bacterium]
MTPRHQTQTERDLEGLAAKKRRETEPQGVRIPPELAAPHVVTDPATGVVKGPALDAIREERPPAERFRHLEARCDRLEAEKEELLKTVLDMAKRGFNAKLELGTATANEKLAWWRDLRGTAVKVVLIVAGAIATFFAGRGSK